jgi:rubrerythrin
MTNEELANENMEVYYPCCGKSICRGCNYSLYESGNDDKCPFCNSERMGITDEEQVADM